MCYESLATHPSILSPLAEVEFVTCSLFWLMTYNTLLVWRGLGPMAREGLLLPVAF